jgi:hypothetical protein
MPYFLKFGTEIILFFHDFEALLQGKRTKNTYYTQLASKRQVGNNAEK